jgi:hypothetical protein
MNHLTRIPTEQEKNEGGQTVLTLKTASPIVAEEERGFEKPPEPHSCNRQMSEVMKRES